MGKSRANRYRYCRTLAWVICGTSAFACASGVWTPSAHAATLNTTWDGSTGDWFDPTHWSGDVPINSPIVSYGATINSGTVSLNANTTVSDISIGSAATLLVGANVTAAIGPLFNGSSISGHVDLQSGALLDVSSTNMFFIGATITGDGTYEQVGGTLFVNGNSTVNNFTLAGGSVTNGGTLAITHEMDWINASSMTTRLLIARGATLNFMATANQTFGGTITNAGVTQFTGTQSYVGQGTFINAGTLSLGDSVTGGTNLTLSTFTSTGLLNLSAGSTLFSTGNLTLSNATVSGAGILRESGGSLLITGSSSIDNLSLENSAEFIGSGTLTVNHTFFWGGANPSPLVVLIGPNASLVDTTGINNAGLINNQGVAFLGTDTAGHLTSATYVQGLGLSNSGIVYADTNINGGGTISNSGLLTTLATPAGVQRTVQPFVYNTGTISGGFILSNGTSSGLLSPDAGTVSRTLTLNGIFDLMPGAAITSANNGITVSSSTLILSGNIPADHLRFGILQGSGTLTLSGSDFWSAPNVVNQGAPIVHLTAGGSLYLLGGSLGSGTVVNDGALYAGLSGPGGTYLGGTFQTSGSGNIVNNGTLFDDMAITATMTNSGLIIISNSANGTSRTLSGRINNAGTIDGLITLNNLTNTGVLTGDTPFGGRVLTLSGSAVLQDGSHITSQFGTVNATSQILIIGNVTADHFIFTNILYNTITSSGPTAGTLYLTGPNAINADTTLSGPGQTIVLPTGTLRLPANLFLTAHTFINQGEVDQTGSNILLSIDSNSVFFNQGTMYAPGALSASASIAGPGAFFNSGALSNFTSTSFSSLTITAPFCNTGTVTARSFNTLNSIVINNGSSSGGTFIAQTGASIKLGLQQTPYILNNSTLAGAGSFSGYIVLQGINSVSNGAFPIISGAGELDVSGALNASSITLGAFVRVLPTGVMAQKVVIDGSTLENQGITGNTFSGSGQITLLHGGIFINQGTFTSAQGFFITVGDTGSPPVSFINSGTLNFSTFSNSSVGNLGIPTLSGAFTNSGLITLTNLSFTVYPNFPLYNTGTITLTGNSQLNLPGGVVSGTMVANGGTGAIPVVQFSNVLLDNATLSAVGSFFSAPFVGTVTLADTSYADVAGFSSIKGPGTLLMRSLILPQNAPPATISGGAQIILLPGGSWLDQGGIATPPMLDASAFTNQGTITVVNNPSFFKLVHGSTFNNQGLITDNATLSNNSGFSISADGDTRNAFINSGTISVSASVTLAAPTVNSGYIKLAAGGLFSGPLNNTGIIDAGNGTSFSSPPLSTIVIAGSGVGTGLFTATSVFPLANISFTAPYTLDNATLVGNIGNSAPLTIRDTVSGSLLIDGDINGPGTLSGSFAWEGGDISNAGGVQLSSASHGRFTLTATVNGVPQYIGDLYIIGGAAPFNATKAVDGITLTIPAGYTAAWGTRSIGPSDSILLKNGGRFINNGSFYSFVETISINSADNVAGEEFINNGVFGRSSAVFPGGPAITTFTVPFHNSGLVDIQQGFIDFAGGYFNDGGGTIQFAAGTGLSFSGGAYDFGTAPIDLGSGGLAGTGTVHGNFTSAGTISPGHSPGALTINGNLTLDPSAELDIQLAGTTPGTLFDTLTVTGSLDLDGTLSLTLLNGYLPNESDSFKFLMAGDLSGTLENAPDGARFADAGSQGTFLVTYASNAITLSDFQVTVPEPLSLAWLSPAVLLLLRRGRARTAR